MIGRPLRKGQMANDKKHIENGMVEAALTYGGALRHAGGFRHGARRGAMAMIDSATVLDLLASTILLLTLEGTTMPCSSA
jgi:hypothetical protein